MAFESGVAFVSGRAVASGAEFVFTSAIFRSAMVRIGAGKLGAMITDANLRFSPMTAAWATRALFFKAFSMG
ncbi:hypothetical protein B4Q13_20030 [Lacticaseibacillus rhamnosus]